MKNLVLIPIVFLLIFSCSLIDDFFVDDNEKDTEKPVLTVSPVDSSVSGTVTISGTASDNVGVDRIEVGIKNFEDGSNLSETAAGINPWSFSFNTTNYNDRDYTITISAYDKASPPNISTQSIKIKIENGINNDDDDDKQDTEKPELRIIYPTNNQIVTDTISISGTAIDDVKVERVEVKMTDSNNQMIFSERAYGTIYWQYIYNTTEADDGDYTITVSAYDTSANKSTQSITIKIQNGTNNDDDDDDDQQDNEGPELTVPPIANPISGILALNGTAKKTTDYLDYVKVEINDSDNINVFSGEDNYAKSWFVPIDTTAIADGNYTITISVYDTASPPRISTQSINITINNDAVSNQETKWVEVGLAADYKLYTKFKAYGYSEEQIESAIMEVMNTVDQIYQGNYFNPPIRIKVVQFNLFKDGDPYSIDLDDQGRPVSDGHLRDTFMNWARTNITNVDVKHLLTGYKTPSSLGMTNPYTVGTYRAAGYSRTVYSPSDHQFVDCLAATVAHEIGHNLGLTHDRKKQEETDLFGDPVHEDYINYMDTSACTTFQTIMAGGSGAYYFSECSKKQWNLFITYGRPDLYYGFNMASPGPPTCLDNIP